MKRNSFILKLATQKKFAYVSEDLSVTSTLDTSTSSEGSLSPIPEENSTSSKALSASPLQGKNTQSNVLISNTCRATLSTESEFSDDKIDTLEEKLLGLRSEISCKFGNTKDMFTYSTTSELSDNDKIIKKSALIPEIPVPEVNSTSCRAFNESPLQEKIIVLSNVLIPNTSQPTSSTESELGDDLFTYPTILELRDNNEIIQDSVLIPGILTSKCLSLNVIEQPGNVFAHTVSNDASFQEHLQNASTTPISNKPELCSENSPTKNNPLSMQTNIQDGDIQNLENVDFIDISGTQFDSNLKSDIYDGSQHLVSVFDETDSKENETCCDNFEDIYSSGSEYIPSNDSTSFSDSTEIFEVMEVNKTYSKGNSIEQPIKASDKMPAKNKEIVQGILDISNNQNPEHVSTNPMFNASKSETIPDNKNKYVKSHSARERPTLCPICYQDVVTHFPRHLFRHHKDHKDVKLIDSLKPGSSERLALISALRKQGYFHLTTEKDVVNPVRSSKDPNTEYFVCTFCLGHYSKKLMYKHVKICKNKPVDMKNAGRSCLSQSQTFMASVMSRNQEYLRTSRIKKEVFDIMRADNISNVAKNDPLICLYGESLLTKHKRQQIANVVSNKIREMARMLITIKSLDGEISSFFDVLRPEMFGTLLSAAKIISGYDDQNKSFRAPSLALHMGTNLKLICNIAFKIVIEKRKLPKIQWEDREKKKSDIKDLRKLIEAHWCNEISSLALKTLKERQWETTVQLPLTSDILLFQTYIHDLASNAYEKLKNQIEIRKNYKILTECVLTHTVMFNRKRVGDVQYLKIKTYEKENQRIDQEAFTESLTTVEKLLCKKFKRVVTGGKGSKPVPILFSPRVQKYITCLLEIRKTSGVVPNTNPYLFANPNSENKWMAGTKVIRCLAKNCGAKEPKLLTSTKFRKHIATTLQLMTMESNDMEQIAKFMGHTKKTHSEFYRLPQDIYQTAKVAKVLLLLEKGRGKEFRGKNLSEIELEKDVYYSSESEDDSIKNIRNEKLTKGKKRKAQVSENETSDEDFEESAQNIKKKFGGKNSRWRLNEQSLQDRTNLNEIEKKEEQFNKPETSGNENNYCAKEHQEKEQQSGKMQIFGNETNGEKECQNIKLNKSKEPLKTIKGRVRWNIEEKKLVLKYFQTHLKDKVTPRKHECDEFIRKHGKFLVNKDWVKIKTFVYNCFRQV